MPKSLPLCLALVGLLPVGAAHASSNYPAEIQSKLGLSYTPPCALCHANGVTGLGTVTTPFGKSMKDRGLVAQNLASLDTALAALEAENTDSDGDGIPDITELKNGTNPNGGGKVDPATYGCFSITGQGTSATPGALWFLALAAGLGLRRRRASCRR